MFVNQIGSNKIKTRRFDDLFLVELISFELTIPNVKTNMFLHMAGPACQFLWVSIHCILQLFGGTCRLQEHTRGLVHVGRVCVVVVVCGTGGC